MLSRTFNKALVVIATLRFRYALWRTTRSCSRLTQAIQNQMHASLKSLSKELEKAKKEAGRTHC